MGLVVEVIYMPWGTSLTGRYPPDWVFWVLNYTKPGYTELAIRESN